jgi:hypothetical protein
MSEERERLERHHERLHQRRRRENIKYWIFSAVMVGVMALAVWQYSAAESQWRSIWGNVVGGITAGLVIAGFQTFAQSMAEARDAERAAKHALEDLPPDS